MKKLFGFLLLSLCVLLVGVTAREVCLFGSEATCDIESTENAVCFIFNVGECFNNDLLGFSAIVESCDTGRLVGVLYPSSFNCEGESTRFSVTANISECVTLDEFGASAFYTC
uniref:Uncharacterized protein n=1 Tax=Timspurckia oligopyrenoides TaxID=708627 RepID=A0A7S0ZKA0_9RHOD